MFCQPRKNKGEISRFITMTERIVFKGAVKKGRGGFIQRTDGIRGEGGVGQNWTGR